MDRPGGEGRVTIMIVEDDDTIRALVTRSLVCAGYHVLDAASGHEAAVVSSRYDGPIHLLIADAILPGMNGEALAEMVSRQRPETRLLFMSGYAHLAPVPQWAHEQGLFLQKPFRPEDLVTRVKNLLRGEPPPSP